MQAPPPRQLGHLTRHGYSFAQPRSVSSLCWSSYRALSMVDVSMMHQGPAEYRYGRPRG
ncbi:hypothetical protein BGZ63DRAFT_207231 [Mariannaea sp. PMI_226]|nr:hypothetical protein BGZ63DRAFT_207231 [Mariannaea sp. PMI_226]